MRVRVLYHDHCFDGAASAAFFSRFVEEKFYPGAEFSFTGLAHKASQLFEPGMFDGAINAIVDFKYSTDPHLTWWFDHHQSAFLSPEDGDHLLRRLADAEAAEGVARKVHRRERGRAMTPQFKVRPALDDGE